MQRAVRLRPWQQQALAAFSASRHPDFLAVATPGAGKTTFALAAALTDLAGTPGRRVVVVAPTQHLKIQWAKAAARFGLHLQPEWSPRQGLPRDLHGVVTTYQQVASAADALMRLTPEAFAVFDELHHAGEERAWGDAVRLAFTPARRRLAISGTPFRSDTHAIPFIRYEGDEARPDYTYGYGQALTDGGVVRAVHFPRIDGEMEWTGSDGIDRGHTFADPLDRQAAGQRLRTALSLEGGWLPEVLAQAHAQLLAVRTTHPAAGGLVIASDVEHAQGIAALLREQQRVHAHVATSDDPAASRTIARFAEGTDPWIVAVRMVSEGVDIPRLRVGVYATTTTTELFFRQAVGRLVRWTRGLRSQKAYLFIPDDVRLRGWAATIAEERTHSLRRREDTRDPDLEAPLRPGGADEQLSLFAALSSSALGGHQVEEDDEGPLPTDDELGVLVTLAAAPPLAGTAGDALFGDAAEDLDEDPPLRTRAEQQRLLRTANAERTAALATATRRTHAQVNAELNKLAGLRSIGEATVEQLERRLKHADTLLRRL